MNQAFICDAIRTPFGRYGGALSSVRTDDLGAVPLRALMARNPHVDWGALTDVLFGCANQAGEDNRNVARMSSLLAGLPLGVPGGGSRTFRADWCASARAPLRGRTTRSHAISPVRPRRSGRETPA